MAETREEKPEDVALKVEHDLGNEQTIIASVLHSATLRDELTKKYPPDYFTDPQHTAIWAAMRALRQQALKFDIPALMNELGGAVPQDYIKDLMQSQTGPAANIKNHVELLEWDVAKVRGIEGALTALLKGLKNNEKPGRIRALAKSTSVAFDIKIGQKYMKDPAALAASAAKQVRDRAATGHYEFGIPELDYFDDGTPRMVPGAAPGDTTLITGVSGSAKSTVVARMVYEQARMGKRVLMGAWEMGPEMTIGLMACFARGWPRSKVVLGNMTPKELLEFQDTCEQIGQYVRFFDAPFSDAPTAKHTNEAALDMLYQNIADSGCSMCVMDLWERMIPDANPERERRALFAQQGIAQDTQTHCILLCQQKSKVVEASAGKRPSRNTILGSSAWVDIADNIFGVHRPGLWRGGIDDDILELLILKQRYGRWPLAVQFDWDGDKGWISNGHETEFLHGGDDADDDWLDKKKK